MVSGDRHVLILLGPPGAGKGTQAKVIEVELSLPHISTGDMLRNAIAQKTSLGIEAKKAVDAGQLVTDEIVNGIVGERIEEIDCKYGFVLDGYPRNVSQAAAFNMNLGVRDKLSVIEIRIEIQRLIMRLTARRTCEQCGEIYNLESRPPREDGMCDKCGGELLHRSDDKEDIIRDRMETYRAETEPLAEYYRGEGVYRQIDGTASIDGLTQEIMSVVRGAVGAQGV